MYALKESEEAELLRDLHMQKPAVGRCAFCPEWVINGTAEEVTAGTRAHRENVHQITVKKTARGTGRACLNGSCERPGAITRGRFKGWCSQCRDRVVTDEKLETRRQKAEEAKVRAIKSATIKSATKKAAPKAAVRARPKVVAAREPKRNPMHLMTEERAEEVLRLYAAGHSAISIGRMHWADWGYRNEKSLTQMVYTLLRKRGISRRSRSEAVLLTIAREGPRKATFYQPSFLTEERLELVEKLVADGCSVRAIASVAWAHWGFASIDSCREAIMRHGRRRGRNVERKHMREIPLVSRTEAKELILAT